MTKETTPKLKEGDIIELECVWAVPCGTNPAVGRRKLKYRKAGSMLVAVESNEGHPVGFVRVRESQLPKLGGVLGYTVAARTYEEARKHLMDYLYNEEKELQGKLYSIARARAHVGEL